MKIIVGETLSSCCEETGNICVRDYPLQTPVYSNWEYIGVEVATYGKRGIGKRLEWYVDADINDPYWSFACHLLHLTHTYTSHCLPFNP